MSHSRCFQWRVKWHFGYYLKKQLKEAYHFFPNGVVSRFQVIQHFLNNFFGVTLVAHGVQEIDRSLANRNIALSLLMDTIIIITAGGWPLTTRIP